MAFPIKKKAGTKPGAAKKGAEKAEKKPAAKKSASKKKPKILFKAPADFKPAFFEVEFETLKDGLVNPASLQVQRVKGKWDNEDAKRFNLAEYDIPTLVGIASRLGAIYAPNVLKRLPPKTKFGMILRCNKKAADDTLAVPVKAAKMMVEKNGKMKWKWFEDKKDPTYRKLRKITRILPGAFVSVQLPPSRAKKSKKDADEE